MQKELKKKRTVGGGGEEDGGGGGVVEENTREIMQAVMGKLCHFNVIPLIY